MITETIRTMLLSDNRVTSITQNVHSDFLPQNISLPAITYFRIDGLPEEGLVSNTNITRDRFQIDAFAKTRSDAANLAEQVRLVLQKFRGSVDGQWIQEISLVIGPRDQLDPVEAGSSSRRFYTSADYFVFYSPPT